MWKVLGIGALLGLGTALVTGWAVHRGDVAHAERVWAALDAGRESRPARSDPFMVADLPPVARRYFARAIEPGTPLHRVVQLEMAGTFILNGKALPTQARQILAPPGRGFVWQARMGQGVTRFAGSDGYLRTEGREESWTKFWLAGLVPLARIGGGSNHPRAAATRAMAEALWVPATLLPQFGATWRQTGPDSAELHFADTPDLPPLHLTFDPQGDIVEIMTLRWSDANHDKTYRLQPFGGRMLATAVFQGFRIPVTVELGNLWGTPDYVPFFKATVSSATY
jgi:hypothetical protein